MTRTRWILVGCAALLQLGLQGQTRLHAQAPRTNAQDVDFGGHFARYGVEGAFVLYDLADDSWVRHNPEMVHRRAVPASTFKIFHSLVALETGVIEDEKEVIPWDGVDRGSSGWNRDQTLRSAFERSAVWAYQELARRIGPERMRMWLQREAYGNGDISGGIDQFWLDGGLRISPEEQVHFLRRLYEGRLGFSERTMKTVRRIMVVEEGPDFTLRAKTGWARLGERQIGWLVGWVETCDRPYFFALELDTGDPAFPMREARERIAYGILRELELLPGGRSPE